MSAVAVRWPDVTTWMLGYLPGALLQLDEPATFVRDEIPSLPGDVALAKPYRHLIVAVFPGARITPVTRSARATLQAWIVKANGLPDLAAATRLAEAAGFALEQAPPVTSPINFAEIDTGPTRTKDSTSAVEYMAVTLSLEVNAL